MNERITVPIHLRWGDQDALGHVNNATMLRLLEEARFRAFWGDSSEGNEPGTAVLSGALAGSTEGNRDTVVAGLQIEYRKPLHYRGTPIDIQVWFTRFGGASFDIGYEVAALDNRTRVVYAIAISTMVFVDPTSGAPKRITEAERAAWEPSSVTHRHSATELEDHPPHPGTRIIPS